MIPCPECRTELNMGISDEMFTVPAIINFHQIHEMDVADDIDYSDNDNTALKVVLEANLEVFSAFSLLSELVKYNSKLCKIFLIIVKLYVDYKNVIQFFNKCKELIEFEEF